MWRGAPLDYAKEFLLDPINIPVHIDSELKKLYALYQREKLNYESIKRWVDLIGRVHDNQELRPTEHELPKDNQGLPTSSFVRSISESSIALILSLLTLDLDKQTTQAIVGLARQSREFGAHTFFQKMNAYADNIFLCDLSFSQEGEDLILKKIFGGAKNGFYVDVGAYHPIQFSNTYYFYTQGWHGINIEPNRKYWDIFESARNRDYNINCAVGVGSGEYFVYDEPAYNTFSKDRVVELENSTRKKPVKVVTGIVSKSLRSILLEQNVSEIDFLNIDVEGSEIQVLESNNWALFSPKIILIEQTERELEKIMLSEVYRFLKEKGYALVTKTYSTSFYKLKT